MSINRSSPFKVLHVLANSSPDLNGYAIRSHDMLVAQKASGLVEPIAITSPYYPDRKSMSEDFVHQGIQYIRCKHPAYHEKLKGTGRRWIAKRGKKKIDSAKHKKTIKPEKPAKGFKLMRWYMKWGTIHSLRKMKKLATPVIYTYNIGSSWIEERIQFKWFMENIQNVVVEHSPDIIPDNADFLDVNPSVYRIIP